MVPFFTGPEPPRDKQHAEPVEFAPALFRVRLPHPRRSLSRSSASIAVPIERIDRCGSKTGESTTKNRSSERDLRRCGGGNGMGRRKGGTLGDRTFSGHRLHSGPEVHRDGNRLTHAHALSFGAENSHRTFRQHSSSRAAHFNSTPHFTPHTDAGDGGARHFRHAFQTRRAGPAEDWPPFFSPGFRLVF
ncbi:FERM domain-containing protein 4B-like isoform X1 [Anopheles sinensis]|uniref:FERM domain-containing protein 4B-like isoform X1 n=1 Tax=Anopheles sinensis TaxID=74873 RepID=A0A084W3T5_ANOSI|nr:FERM domain-containing protein 4B-like isoform X1 [Anopheles sinensis]